MIRRCQKSHARLLGEWETEAPYNEDLLNLPTPLRSLWSFNSWSSKPSIFAGYRDCHSLLQISACCVANLCRCPFFKVAHLYQPKQQQKPTFTPLSTIKTVPAGQETFLETNFKVPKPDIKMRFSSILLFSTTALAFSEISLNKRQQFTPEVTTAEGATCADAFGPGYETCQ